MSESEYARMFKKYYDVIGQEDPSARYAVSAPGGLKNNEDWGSQKNFFEGFIDSYKNQFGSALPGPEVSIQPVVRMLKVPKSS